MTSPQVGEVPEDVRTLGVSADLGRHQASFGQDRPPAPKVLPYFAIAAGLAAATLLFDRVRGGRYNDFGGLIVFALWLVVALVALYPVLTRIGIGFVRRLTARVWLFERGFIERRGRAGKLEPYPWEQCRVRIEIRDYQTADGRHSHTTHRYTVERDDGTWTLLAGTSSVDMGIPGLGQHVACEIAARRLPPVREAIARGDSSHFDTVTLDPTGIATRGVSLAWAEVDQLEIADCQLRLHRLGNRRPAAVIPMHKVLDPDVLLTIADELMRAARP
jgi:hypothetical protein